MTLQQQQYAYQQRLRRQALIAHHNLLAVRVQRVKQYLAAGGSKDDPQVRDEYLALVTELGPGIFVTEDDSEKAMVKE